MNTDRACSRSYSADTLSAFRDNLLPAEVAAAVHAHTPECQACQTTLAHFDKVARTLRLQRELEPGQRVWSGVRHDMHQRRQPMSITARRVLGGLGAALAVLVVVVLFAQLLHAKQGNGKVTTTATGTPTGKPTPTPTFSATPGVPNFVTAAQAWGPNAGSTFSTALDAQHIFVTDRVAADGTAIYGNDILLPANQSQGFTGATGALTIATKQFTPFAGLMPAGTMGSPSCCYTDGRYLLATDNSQPGGTCGPCHTRLWAKDMQTGEVRKLVDGGIGQTAFDVHGVVLYQNVITTNGFLSLDIATGASTPLANMPDPAKNSVGLQSFAWPLIVYTSTPQNQNAATTEHIHNVTTGADITLDMLTGVQGDPASTHIATLSGDTLFYTSQVGNAVTVYQLDHPMTAGVQPHALGTYQAGLGDLAAANARLLIFNGLYTFAWDRVQQRFVLLESHTNDPAGTTHVGSSLTGDWLMVHEQAGFLAPQTVTLFNSANLPTQG